MLQILLFVLLSIGSAHAEDGDDRGRFVVARDGVEATISAWYPPTALPERVDARDRVCRVMFYGLSDASFDYELEFCKKELAQSIRDVLAGWEVTLDGVQQDERTFLFELWFVYPGVTGSKDVRMYVRQAADTSLILPADVDPLMYGIKAQMPPVFPEEAMALDTRDTSCRAEVDISSTGLPSNVWVSDCDDVFRAAAERGLRRWMFDIPLLDGTPFRTAVSIGLRFVRVVDGPAAPGIVVLSFPQPPDMQGRADVGAERFVDLFFEPEALPSNGPRFTMAYEPFSEVEVYRLVLPDAFDGEAILRCPLMVGVTADRRQQVWIDPSCPESVSRATMLAAEKWLLAVGEVDKGQLYSRFRSIVVFPGAGTPYLEIDSRMASYVAPAGWPSEVLPVASLVASRRVTPKLSRTLREQGEGGSCVMRVRVSERGLPRSVEIVSCPDSYRNVSLRTARKWRWERPAENAEPVATVVMKYK